MSRVGIEIEICARSVIFLLRCHHPRILSTLSVGSRGGLSSGLVVGETADNEGFPIPPLVDIINEIKETLRRNLLVYRDVVGINLAAFKHILRDVEAKRTMNQFLGDVPEAAQITAPPVKKRRKKGNNK